MNLEIMGLINNPRTLCHQDLTDMPGVSQIEDVSVLDSKRQGRGVAFEAIIQEAQLQAEVAFVTFHASRDDFHASVPLDLVKTGCVLIYELNGEALPLNKGGPFRFFVPNPEHCQSAELDECANVKFLDRIEFSQFKGQDNRPSNEAEHEAHHQI